MWVTNAPILENTHQVDALRQQVAFDIERLRAAAIQLESLDHGFQLLREKLESRAWFLSKAARLAQERSERQGMQLKFAKAQALAHLAAKAAIGEVLGRREPVAIVASMATLRWVSSLHQVSLRKVSELRLKGYFEAGRVAHKTVRTLRPGKGLRPGIGAIVSGLLVLEFACAENRSSAKRLVLEALRRCRRKHLTGDTDMVRAVSQSLRVAADLLERMYKKAEPYRVELEQKAETLEDEVEAAFARVAVG